MRRPVIGLNTNFTLLDKYWQFHIRDTYIDAIQDYGGLPLPIPCTTDPDQHRQYLELLDGIVFIGGKDYPSETYGETPAPELDPAHPRRSDADLALMKAALGAKLPILGICAGAQLLNIALGGKLVQHLPEACDHLDENYHEIEVLGGRWLPKLFPEMRLIGNSNHHQAPDPNALGRRLILSARCGNVSEAVELDDERMVLGIQWHPERIRDLDHRKRIFELLMEQAGRR
jgi:putative glutamine amidotransferase